MDQKIEDKHATKQTKQIWFEKSKSKIKS